MDCNELDEPTVEERRKTRMAELEKLLEPLCGKCYHLRSIVCPRRRVDVKRMVKISPRLDALGCDKWNPNEEYAELDQEYIYLKLQEGLHK